VAVFICKLIFINKASSRNVWRIYELSAKSWGVSLFFWSWNLSKGNTDLQTFHAVAIMLQYFAFSETSCNKKWRAFCGRKLRSTKLHSAWRNLDSKVKPCQKGAHNSKRPHLATVQNLSLESELKINNTHTTSNVLDCITMTNEQLTRGTHVQTVSRGGRTLVPRVDVVWMKFSQH
jgi:hypothetical protein